MRHSLIALSLVTGLANSMIVPAALAASDETPPPTVENQEAQNTWIQSLKVQVEVTRAKTEVLTAEAAHRIRKAGDEAAQALERAKANLDAAYAHADQAARVQITAFKGSVGKTQESIRSNADHAADEIERLVGESEALLASTVAETQTKAGVVRKELAARLALAQARAETLSAKVALEVEQAPDKARNALEKTEQYLDEAKASATEKTRQEIADLRDEAGAAKEALTSSIEDARTKVDALATHTETTLNAYAERIKESEEAALLRKHYAQLEAQASLLKARIAAEAEATEEQALSHLETAKAWFARARTGAEEAADAALADMEETVDKAKTELSEKQQQAQKSIADLLIRTAKLLEKLVEEDEEKR